MLTLACHFSDIGHVVIITILHQSGLDRHVSALSSIRLRYIFTFEQYIPAVFINNQNDPERRYETKNC
jgi:hypothetical protein